MNIDFVKAIIDEWDPVDLLAYAPNIEVVIQMTFCDDKAKNKG